jgi:hypothetical protein
MNTPFRVLTLAIALAALQPVVALAADPIGKVIFQSGGAVIVDAAGKQRAANKGDLIMPGERLVTGSNALTQVKMRDGSFVGLRPGTDLKFQEMRLTGKDAGQDVALNSGSIRVLNLPGDGAVKPLPVNVQAGDARIVMKGADMESAVKRDLSTGPETITRLNHGTGTLTNGIKTLDLAVNEVNLATKTRIGDAPISALPPVDVRPIADPGQAKNFGTAPIQTVLTKGDLVTTLPSMPLDARVATDVSMTQGLKNTIVSTFTPTTSLSGINSLAGVKDAPPPKDLFVSVDPLNPANTKIGIVSTGSIMTEVVPKVDLTSSPEVQKTLGTVALQPIMQQPIVTNLLRR